MTIGELTQAVNDLKKRLEVLEKKNQGRIIGGDPGFFDQPDRLDTLERTLAALIQSIREKHPETYQDFCRKNTSSQNSAQIRLNNQVERGIQELFPEDEE